MFVMDHGHASGNRICSVMVSVLTSSGVDRVLALQVGQPKVFGFSFLLLEIIN
jgi:hypothetical protein